MGSSSSSTSSSSWVSSSLSLSFFSSSSSSLNFLQPQQKWGLEFPLTSSETASSFPVNPNSSKKSNLQWRLGSFLLLLILPPLLYHIKLSNKIPLLLLRLRTAENDKRLKRDRQKLLQRHQIFIVEGDLNDTALLAKLFDVVPFTQMLHLAAQAGVRYAMKNPQSYVSSNIAGFINLLEVAKAANPQPAIVWASSSSVYGLNTQVPFSENHQTDQPASLYAATKKAGEEIAQEKEEEEGGGERGEKKLKKIRFSNFTPVPRQFFNGVKSFFVFRVTAYTTVLFFCKNKPQKFFWKSAKPQGFFLEFTLYFISPYV
ncbi:uncharacterized protein [Euphorbia lathyris]|uniref:uncharacterized protein n=1 Tax=Euphorbia lathyris TaxID=212925 RepID=UPI0033135D9A